MVTLRRKTGNYCKSVQKCVLWYIILSGPANLPRTSESKFWNLWEADE